MKRSLFCFISLMSLIATARADTSLDAARLALKSSGVASDRAWVLDQNGYVGGYLQVPADGKVSITVRAGGHGDGAAPHMNIVVADSRSAFDVSDPPKDFTHETVLPAGTHFLRIELTNASSARSLLIAGVRVTGGSIVSENTNELALAAADAYVAHYRKGPAVVSLPGIAAGTSVHVKLKNHAFDFGACVSPDEKNGLIDENVPPNSDTARYQQFINAHFSAIVAGNAGKWAYNERKSGDVTMQTVDKLLAYGKQHGQRVRMHNLIWGNQQPDWVHALIKRALTGDAEAKVELRQAISRRIGYYLGERAKQFTEVDVLNEARLNPSYWKIFGPAGIADIYTECAAALKKSGATAMLLTNEYNVLQWSVDLDADGKGIAPDPYANWYRREVEDIRSAGGAVTAIGVQYYADISVGAQNDGPHSAARIMQTFQNLSVPGLPIVLTEFGAQRGPDKYADPVLAAQALQESLRLTFGTPQATGFLIWGIRKPWLWDKADVGALLDADWNPTPAGKGFLALMGQWKTDVTTQTDTGGAISFTGFYGDYDVTVRGNTLPMTLTKGQTQYVLRP